MSILGITPTDIRKKLNPQNNPKGFLGVASQVPTQDVQEAIDEWEETVLSRMHPRYQALSDYIDGEIVWGGSWSPGGAAGGETTAQLTLFPVSDVTLYVNYLGRPWSSRRRDDELDSSKYTVDPDTGLITFTGYTPVRGDTLIATYAHTGLSQSRVLKRIVKDLAAVEMARRLNPQDESFDQYTAWETQAYSDLKRMLKDKDDSERLGIKVLDDIDLVDETRVPRMVAQAFDPSGVML